MTDMTAPASPEFTAVSVTDAKSLALLTQYFSDRESSFPTAQGEYRTTYPEAEQFVPPRGLFLLVSASAAAPTPASAAPGEHVFVGCGGIRRLAGSGQSDSHERFEVKHLWLQPQVRGQGWGHSLLAELEQRAAELGGTEMVLDTNSSLEAAGHLYERAGYENIAPYNDNPNATNWYRKVL
jgi:ribosomal protein S18 acetylase RimI-like enzyme